MDAPTAKEVAPAAEIIGVAGIMGGRESEVSDSTQTLLLEAACFSQAVVRRGSRLLGLSSDASLRFERGVDVASVHNASNRAAYLIGKYCTASGAQASHFSSSGADRVEPIHIELRPGQIKRILGLEIGSALVTSLLTPLGFGVSGQGEKLVVSVPSFRQSDVTREIDLIEEVCRLNGYDQIQSAMPSATIAVVAPDDTLNLVRATLRAQGLSEAWLSSLVPADTPGLSKDCLISVLNPLSKDHQSMRQSLVPGLLAATAYNQDRGAKSIWLFESGRVYINGQKAGQSDGNQPGSPAASGDTGVKESLKVAGIICGERYKTIAGATLDMGAVPDSLSGQKSSPGLDYWVAKGLVENIFASLGIDGSRIQFLPTEEAAWASLPWLHPYRSALVALNRPFKPSKKDGTAAQQGQLLWENAITLGYVGQVHPKMRDQMGLRQDAFVFELDLAKIMAERRPKKFCEIATSPSIVRDLTCDFDRAKKVPSHQEVANLIRRKAGQYLRQTELVSIFKSVKESDKLSLTYRLTFQHPSETLTGEEIDKVMASLRECLSLDLGASFRL